MPAKMARAKKFGVIENQEKVKIINWLTIIQGDIIIMGMTFHDQKCSRTI